MDIYIKPISSEVYRLGEINNRDSITLQLAHQMYLIHPVITMLNGLLPYSTMNAKWEISPYFSHVMKTISLQYETIDITPMIMELKFVIDDKMFRIFYDKLDREVTSVLVNNKRQELSEAYKALTNIFVSSAKDYWITHNDIQINVRAVDMNLVTAIDETFDLDYIINCVKRLRKIRSCGFLEAKIAVETVQYTKGLL